MPKSDYISFDEKHFLFQCYLCRQLNLLMSCVFQFPYCDGSHNKHNEETGDNVGPLLVRKKTK